MPRSLYIRHLPGQGGQIIDEKQLPKDTVALNPSMAHPYLYIRAIKDTKTGEENFIMLYNVEKKTFNTITGLENLLQKNVNRYKGLEDLRLCNFNNKVWFVGTTTHASLVMNSETVLGYFNNLNNRIEAISYIPLGKAPIKNICPFVHKNTLYLFDIFDKKIYEVIDKTTQKSLNDKSKEFATKEVFNLKCGNNIDIDDLRGSTSPIHLHGNLYGCVVHSIIYNDGIQENMKIAYMHYWLEFDMETGEITFISSPFWVTTFGIEFISGINKEKENIELYIGVQDKMAVKYITTLYSLRCGK